MESLRNLLLLIIVAALAAVGGYFIYTEIIDTDDDTKEETTLEDDTNEQVEATNTIVEIATASDDLSTLTDALTAAGLTSTLQGDGPFTVFAPLNGAFSDIQEKLDLLLEPENQEDLVSFLQYHVVSGELMAGDLEDGLTLTTLNGGTLTVAIEDNVTYIMDEAGNKAMVVTADVEATNGVVHVIDFVLTQE